MKTPDKIYVSEAHHGWYDTNEGGDKIEYIRKDALVDPIKEQLRLCPFSGGMAFVLDIINSL